MKKTLSIIIAIAMIAAMALPMGIFASAEEVVEIATWAEFVEKAEAAFGEGSYKLTADVTADTPISSFTGTFDGNGHTVYVAATMFSSVGFGGVIKNFTTQLADVDVDNGDGTTSKLAMVDNPIAEEVTGGAEDFPIVFENITNNVPVVEKKSQRPAAGIIGRTEGDTYLIAKNLVNNADIATCNQTGGVIGNVGHSGGTLYILAANLVNNGDVYANNSYGGGIIGNINGGIVGTLTACVNNGDIVAQNDAGGIVSNIGEKSEVTFNFCANTGVITQNPVIDEVAGTKLAGADKTSAKYGAAGIVARSNKADTIININNCVVGGALAADTTETEAASADAFNGYANGGTVNVAGSSYLYGMYTAGTGAITATAGEGFAAVDQVTIDAAIATYTEACKDFDPGTFAAPSEAPAAPEVTLPSTPDTNPPADDTTAPVVDDTTAPVVDDTTAPVVDDTTAPVADDTTAPSKPETGDNTFAIVLAVVAVAAIGCVAVSLRKREEN